MPLENLSRIGSERNIKKKEIWGFLELVQQVLRAIFMSTGYYMFI